MEVRPKGDRDLRKKISAWLGHGRSLEDQQEECLSWLGPFLPGELWLSDWLSDRQ